MGACGFGEEIITSGLTWPESAGARLWACRVSAIFDGPGVDDSTKELGCAPWLLKAQDVTCCTF